MKTTKEVKEALLKAYPYKIELHAHTKPISACSDIPAIEVVERYHALGADGVVITNHFLANCRHHEKDDWIRMYMKDFLDAKARGAELGVQVYLGMEVRFPQNNNDYLVYGVDEALLEQTWDLIDTDLPTYYQSCAADDRVIVQAHPYRDGMELAAPAYLDGLEVFNLHPQQNSRVAVAAARHAAVGGVLTGGTDFHHAGHEGMIFARLKELPADSFALARLLKAGDYLFQVGNTLIMP